MYSDIDLGLVYLLLRTANRPLIRTKLNEFVKVAPNGFGLSKNLLWPSSFISCVHDRSLHITQKACFPYLMTIDGLVSLIF